MIGIFIISHMPWRHCKDNSFFLKDKYGPLTDIWFINYNENISLQKNIRYVLVEFKHFFEKVC